MEKLLSRTNVDDAYQQEQALLHIINMINDSNTKDVTAEIDALLALLKRPKIRPSLTLAAGICQGKRGKI